MRHHPIPSRGSQAGYSMVELMVAVVIALFLLTGLFSILQGTRNTSTNQSALAQLQDNERIAVTMMTDVIQEAGFYPNTVAVNTPVTSAFAPDATFGLAGQLVLGGANPNGTTYGESIAVRYQPDATGTVLGCTGQADSAATHTYEFLVQPVVVAGQNVNTLECIKDGGAAVPLVSGVNTLTFMYGVASNGGKAANAYQTATQLTANQAAGTHPNWGDVYSVKMTLTFPNPLYGQPGQSAQTMTFVRVVSIMKQNGVNM